MSRVESDKELDDFFEDLAELEGVGVLLEGIDGKDFNLFDNLTGLFSRQAFEKMFKEILEETKKNDRILSFVFLDIDFFTKVNAEFGHQAGDEVLKIVANSMREIVGKSEIVARYGGEEFVVLFPNKEREQAFLHAERIRAALDKAHVITLLEKTVEVAITLSGGVAAYPTDGQSESDIVRKADQALYRAKKTGRNKICIAQEEKMATKTTHYTLTQLERLAKLAKEENVGEAVLLREALDDLLFKYKVSEIES
ncbi:MAG: GGDEF domain-containing protein [Proteobacteria bacterium]|nr:GGDEF domain-containing protein [Pseudomonadota bacterium]